MTNHIVHKLLSLLSGKGERASLENLRMVLSEHTWQSESEKEIAENLVAKAHLCSFDFDPHEVMFAIDYFEKKKDEASLKNILDSAMNRNNLKIVNRINEIGKSCNIPNLVIPDFHNWVISAMMGFDLYLNHEKGISFMDRYDEWIIRTSGFENRQGLEEKAQLAFQNPHISRNKKMILMRLINELPPFTNLIEEVDDFDDSFRNYAKENGIEIIRVIQSGINDIRRASHVYLIQDRDGIFKIAKELVSYKGTSLEAIGQDEFMIYERLKDIPDAIIPCYGKFAINERSSFIKLPFNFATQVDRFSGKLSIDEAVILIARSAKSLERIHSCDVLHLDIKPSNITFDGETARFFDFGVSKKLSIGETETPIWLADPKYGTPECGKTLTASKASDIFQLGIVFHEMITGNHPFANKFEFSEGDRNRESAILKYFWPNMVASYVGNLDQQLGDKRLSILAQMLDSDPTKRPSAEEVTKYLEGGFSITVNSPVWTTVNRKEKNTILFPARMGIPHKGHIEYIARLVKLGFHIKISLQRSFTISERDPLPKWIVAKIVSQALFESGIDRENFSFIFTPFYATKEELRYHFAFMPGISDIIAVASSNPSIKDLFQQLPIFDQKTVFGVEGIDYQDLSWGEILRGAVRDDDQMLFQEYAAASIEKTITFSQLREAIKLPEIDFSPGTIRVRLIDETGAEMFIGRHYKYLSPEGSIIRNLAKIYNQCKIIDPYSKNTVIEIDGQLINLEYLETLIQGDIETITYQLTRP
jgi:serine/threonine protein kinase